MATLAGSGSTTSQGMNSPRRNGGIDGSKHSVPKSVVIAMAVFETSAASVAEAVVKRMLWAKACILCTADAPPDPRHTDTKRGGRKISSSFCASATWNSPGNSPGLRLRACYANSAKVLKANRTSGPLSAEPAALMNPRPPCGDASAVKYRTGGNPLSTFRVRVNSRSSDIQLT